MANALEVEHLSVRLGGREVLQDLSFSVRAGEAVAIIGPNGSGETVLLRALIGAVPYRGVVRRAAGTRLGYVPQKLDIKRDLPITGLEFLRAKLEVAKVRAEQIPAVLASVGLGEAVASQPIGSFSGGQFQRLLVAFALIGNPTVLLFDEATAGVDEPGQERLNELIRRLQIEEGLTTLLVSHDLSLVYRHADDVLCLGGSRATKGPPREILTPASLQQLYGGAMRFHDHDAHRT